MVLCTILASNCLGEKEKGGMGCLLVREKQVFERTESVVTQKLGRLQPGAWKPELSTEELKHLTGLPLDEEIKCLLLFCTRGAFKERIVYNLVGSLQNRQSTQMVVGGGQVKMILDPKEKSATTCSSQVHIPHIVGLALSGDNLVAASKILAKDINDEKMTDWAIKELSGHDLKADQSVGLMFACAGRGENWYSRRHVESHLFKKYFPSSVITGFFCDGEIGLNCIPDTKTNAQISPEKKTKVRLTHWYTTILRCTAMGNQVGDVVLHYKMPMAASRRDNLMKSPKDPVQCHHRWCPYRATGRPAHCIELGLLAGIPHCLASPPSLTRLEGGSRLPRFDSECSSMRGSERGLKAGNCLSHSTPNGRQEKLVLFVPGSPTESCDREPLFILRHAAIRRASCSMTREERPTPWTACQ
uniref:FIST C-domain domain-containing protein n=1 Tax=Timema cristinae TaxID=61476 RepID=A0A7R9DAR0_TIMCR|nr:unnamed protein product [Timema cristinae]